MRGRSLLIMLGTLATMTAGCMQIEPTSLRTVNWRSVADEHLNCPGVAEQVGAAQFYDINADNRDDAFVTMRCAPAGKPEADQVEAFDGSSDPKHPARWLVIVSRFDDINVGNCLFFTANRVIIVGRPFEARGGRHDEPVVKVAGWLGKLGAQRLVLVDSSPGGALVAPPCP